MAAGIGSRFGGGIKQLTPVGPGGELIIDYSIYDAIEAGFNKVIFIIRKEIEKDFRSIIGDRMSKVIDLDYAFQRTDDLPEGYTVSPDRKKPWGTGHAVLSVRGMVKEPFCVINADDFYGREGFRVVHDYMAHTMNVDAGMLDMCMAGFTLKNTLSDHGSVTRGVCCLAEDGKTLEKVTETFDIRMGDDGRLFAKDETGAPVPVTAEQYVSMNMWGFPPAFIDKLEAAFPAFLDGVKEGDIKSEYLLPAVVDDCIQKGTGKVTLIPSRDKWFGVTYAEDRQIVIDSIRKLVASGVYPEKLYC